jgi:phage gp16-like protein
MKLLHGNSRARNPAAADAAAERKALLATIHIAKKEMGWDDCFYRDLLEKCFGVATSAALSNVQLAAFMAAIKNRGWKPKQRPGEVDEQVLVFRRRVKSLASQIPNGEERLKGLCQAICGKGSISWCTDIPKMKRLLAALGNILRQETGGASPGTEGPHRGGGISSSMKRRTARTAIS